MARKRKPTLDDKLQKSMRELDELKYLPGADYDAIARAQKELATVGRIRKPTHRRKTVDQLIDEAEERAAAKAAREKLREEKRARRRASEKKRRDAKAKADKAKKG